MLKQINDKIYSKNFIKKYLSLNNLKFYLLKEISYND